MRQRPLPRAARPAPPTGRHVRQRGVTEEFGPARSAGGILMVR
jgi:hypothetical protein